MRSFPGEAMMDGSNSVYGRTLYLTHISLFSSLLSLHPHLPHLASPPHHKSHGLPPRIRLRTRSATTIAPIN